MSNFDQIVSGGFKAYTAPTIAITTAIATTPAHAATLTEIYNQNPVAFVAICISTAWVVWQFGWSVHDHFWNIGHRREEDNDPLSQHRRHTDPLEELDTPDLPE
jgi:hypothetical protein